MAHSTWTTNTEKTLFEDLGLDTGILKEGREFYKWKNSTPSWPYLHVATSLASQLYSGPMLLSSYEKPSAKP